MNMRFTRREFVDTVKSAGALAATRQSAASSTTSIKAVTFDGFAIFDARPVFALAERLFPGKGAELSNLWRTRQFEYALQWGRDQLIAEMFAHPFKADGNALLQWGRDQLIAEMFARRTPQQRY